MNTIGVNFKGHLDISNLQNNRDFNSAKLEEVKNIVEQSTPDNCSLDVFRSSDSVAITNPSLIEAVSVIDMPIFKKWFNDSSVKDISEAFIRMEKYSAFQDELCSKLNKIAFNYFDKKDDYDTMEQLFELTEGNIDEKTQRKSLKALKRSINRYKKQYIKTQEDAKLKFDEIINSPTLDVFKEHGYITEYPYLDETI